MALCLWLLKGVNRECFSAYAGLKQLHLVKGLYFNYYMYHKFVVIMFLYHMLHACMQDSVVVCIYCVFGRKLDAPWDCVRVSPEQ